MNEPHDHSDRVELPPAVAQRLTQQQQAFTSGWEQTRAGAPPPRIEDFLAAVPAKVQSLLRSRLATIDEQFRQRAKDTPATRQLDDSARPDSARQDTARLEHETRQQLPAESRLEHTTQDPHGDKTLHYEPETHDPRCDRTIDPDGDPDIDSESDPDSEPDHLDPADRLRATVLVDSGFSTDESYVSEGPRAEVPGYELISELGRGGMGVVYQARHKKLNRIVALKMVLAGAHAGPTQLARFATEAQAVAHLQHPNIVQIYEVGEQDGLPYFSLEFVNGGDLAEHTDGKPQKARDAARLIATLACAMDHAHQHGVVHRDLKPGNVLLTANGEPKITDFGLAKRMEGESSQTRTGAVLGTPSYMAPEQARGDTEQIGPLTDVHALGAILYELLTGRPPFLAASPMDTIMQVIKDEPVPPTQLEPKLPRDLETICLKCLQKEPSKRYGRSGELAEDLDRFLEGKPILARPISSPERFWRWCRRNPKIAGLSAAVLLLLIAVSVVSTTMAIQIDRQRQRAVGLKRLADQRAQAEESARLLADQSAAEARKAHAEAEENSKVATAQAQLALSTIQTLIDKVQKQLEDVPGNQQLKKELLQTAMEGLKQVAQRAEQSTSIEATMAAAHMKMALIFKQLGETEEAVKQLERCHEIVLKRWKLKPDSDAAKSNVAATFTVLGEMSQDLQRDMPAALNYYREALKLREELYHQPRSGEGELKNRDAVKQGLAEGHTRVGVTLFRLGNPSEALDYFQQALALRKELADKYPSDAGVLQDLARSYNAVGEMCFRLNDMSGATDYYGRCLEVRETLFDGAPDNLRFKQELARSSGMYGEVQVRSGNSADAHRQFKRSLELSQQLALADADNVERQRDLGLAYYRIASLMTLSGEDTAAENYNSECLKVREQLASQDPENDRRKMELMVVLPRCGHHERAARLADELSEGTAVDNELLVDMARCFAQCALATANDPAVAQPYREKALKALETAVANGYSDVVNIQTDSDLASIREHARFAAILKNLQ